MVRRNSISPSSRRSRAARYSLDSPGNAMLMVLLFTDSGGRLDQTRYGPSMIRRAEAAELIDRIHEIVANPKRNFLAWVTARGQARAAARLSWFWPRPRRARRAARA